MMSGHVADQRWYWDGKQIRDRPGRRAGAGSVGAANAALAAADRRTDARRWTRRPSARPRRRSIPVEGGGKPVGGGRFARAAGDADGVPRSRPGSTARCSRCRPALIQEMQLGSGTVAGHHLDRPGGDRLCRPHLRPGRPGDVPAAARARPRPRRFPGRARPLRTWIMRSR